MSKIKQHINLVRYLLKNHAHLRDDDTALIMNVWHKELLKRNLDPHELTAYELMEMVSKNKMPIGRTIERCRRKLQEEEPELRGKKWVDRRRHTEEVKEEIKHWNND